MTDRELEIALEAATTVHRERDEHGRLVPPPAWFDLPVDALERLHRRQVFAREVERAMDPQGLSGTVRAVLARLGW